MSKKRRGQEFARLDDSVSLGEARKWLRANMGEGLRCPCCDQFAKLYERKLIATASRPIIALYREAGMDYAHLPTIMRYRLPDISHQGGYANMSAHWGLIEEDGRSREDGGRAGWWRVTEKGRDWIFERSRVPAYALIYDNLCLGFKGPDISIRESLGERFDYEEAMGPAIIPPPRDTLWG